MTLTAKGQRGHDRLLDAATTVLARDGVSGASIARITDEAGVPKRMVVYYFGSREALLATVVGRIAGQIAADVGSSLPERATPAAASATWLGALWRGATADPQIARAYFALLGSEWSGGTAEALAAMKRLSARVVGQLVETCRGAGYELRGDRRAFAAFAFALLRGLLLEWTEAGDTPALAGARAQAEQALAASFRAAAG
jgi:AcrR family transcriptional regulator